MIINRTTIVNCLISVLLSTIVVTSHAHLVAEQKGTLNFANGGAFLALSAPVSAFDGIDNDGDGRLSLKEFNQHADGIKQQIYERVQLLDQSNSPLPLQGLLLSPVHVDENASVPAKQLMILGRFAINGYLSSSSLHIDLVGKGEDEKDLHITVTADGYSQKMVFSAMIHTYILKIKSVSIKKP